MSSRRTATRQKLLDAAAIVFTERGYGDASVKLIADQAGLTTGALYANFASKTELFLEVAGAQYRAALDEQAPPVPRPASLRDALAQFAHRYAGRIATGSAEALAQSTELMTLTLRDVDGLAAILQAAHTGAFVTTRYFELIAAADEANVAKDQLAMMVIALLSGATYMRVIDPDLAELDTLAATCAHLASAPLPRRPTAAASRDDVEARALTPAHKAQPPPDLVVQDLLAQRPLSLRTATPTLLLVLPLSTIGLLARTHAAIRTVAPKPDDARVIAVLVEEPGGPGALAVTGQGLLDLALNLPAAAEVLDFHLALDPDGRVPGTLDLAHDQASVMLLDNSGLVRGRATGEDPAPAAAGLLASLRVHQ